MAIILEYPSGQLGAASALWHAVVVEYYVYDSRYHRDTTKLYSAV